MGEVISMKNLTDGAIVGLCGFKVKGGYYAIPVLEVQEVIRPQSLTKVPLSPDYVTGLINLRGQIVTSINLRKLFKIEEAKTNDHMNIIVRNGDSLYALMVDEILDVMDVEQSSFESVPDTMNDNIRKYIKGVYKLKDTLLILLDLDKIFSMEVKG